MVKEGYFTDLYTYEVYTPTWEEYPGGVCSCVVSWKSQWKSGNTHEITLTVQGIRTDGSSASLWGHITVGDMSPISLGSQNYPGSPAGLETFDPVTYDVETDDYGNIITPIIIEVGFARNSTEQHYARMTSKDVVLEPPQKSINISSPDGIVCTVNKSPLYVDDEFVVTVTVTGAQWDESPIISVTGATKVKDLTYRVTGNVYIAITGVLANHTIHITKDSGVDVSIIDNATGYLYSDGSTIEHYKVITIICDVNSGYEFGSLMVNGEKRSSGFSMEVTSDVNVVAMSNVLGLVRIFTGTSFDTFLVFIYNGSNWGMYIPLIYDGMSWRICA